MGVLVRNGDTTTWGAQRRGKCCIHQNLEIRGTPWRVISAHLPCTARLLDAGDILEDWEIVMTSPPGVRAVLGADLNETFGGADTEDAVAGTARGSLVLQAIEAAGLRLSLAEGGVPSYHPYNTALRSRRLDYLAVDRQAFGGWVSDTGTRCRVTTIRLGSSFSVVEPSPPQTPCAQAGADRA